MNGVSVDLVEQWMKMMEERVSQQLWWARFWFGYSVFLASLIVLLLWRGDFS